MRFLTANLFLRFADAKIHIILELAKKKLPIKRKSVFLQKYFLSFCIEQYKNEHHISGNDAMEMLNGYGVLEYLKDHYEILHTQSRQWILEDIENYISIRKNRTL